MYRGVFKNNQVTYGNPFQVKAAVDLYKFDEPALEEEENAEDLTGSEMEPEDILEKAKAEAESIIENAKAEAEAIIEQAMKEATIKAESISEEAWQNGYAEGMEAAVKKNEEILAEAEQTLQAAQDERDRILAEMEKEIVELALKVARKVVACELKTNREVVVSIVEEALAACSNRENAVVRVSAEDGEYLEQNKDEALSSISGSDSIKIKPDNSLSPGDCVIETSFGSVDAGANTKMNKIEEAFMDQVASK